MYLCMTLERFYGQHVVFNTKMSLQLYRVAVHGIVKTFFFHFGVQKQTGREKRHPLCMHSGCSGDNGAERKKTHLFTDKLVWTGSQ